MKKVILTVLAIITSISFLRAQDTKADELAITSIISTLETGWNNKSGETFASVFDDVHDYIVVNGMYMPNFTQKANAATHQGLFESVLKEHKLKLKIDKISFIRKDLAMVTALGAGYNKAETMPTDPGIIMTILAEKKEDTWKIISFHNHEINMAELKQRRVPIDQMYANWYK